MTERRTITELILQNVLKIKAIRIRPNGNIVKISGKNASGKSSALSGIEMVLRGKAAFPDEPVRDGEEQGAGQLDLGDIVVTRYLDPHRLVVKYKGTNEKITRPQEFLDSLLNKYTCDPLALLRLSPSDQFEEVKRILGIDFADIDAEYDELYLERRDLNRDIKSIDFQVRNMGDVSGLPSVPIDTDDLISRLEEAKTINKNNARKRFEIEDLRRQVAAENGRIAQLMDELAVLEKSVAEKIERGRKLKEEVDSLQDCDEQELLNKIRDAESANEAVRERQKRESLSDEKREKQEKIDGIELRLAEITETKKEAVRGAEFPVQELEFGENYLLYNGVPFEQASQAEKIRVCFALSMAGDPNIGVVLIREAALLDDDSVELVSKLATEQGFQVWLERVDDSDEMSFVIEDGEIVKSPRGTGDEEKLPLF